MKPNNPEDNQLENKDWREELHSPHSTIGLMLSSILGFPAKGETAGSMKEKLLKELVPFIQSLLDKQAEKLLKNERMRGGRLSMEAYRNGYNDAKKDLTNNKDE